MNKIILRLNEKKQIEEKYQRFVALAVERQQNYAKESSTIRQTVESMVEVAKSLQKNVKILSKILKFFLD